MKQTTNDMGHIHSSMRRRIMEEWMCPCHLSSVSSLYTTNTSSIGQKLQSRLKSAGSKDSAESEFDDDTDALCLEAETDAAMAALAAAATAAASASSNKNHASIDTLLSLEQQEEEEVRKNSEEKKDDDRFGLSDIFLEMTATTEDSELLSPHSFLRARCLKLEATDAFRCLGGNLIRMVAKNSND
jgi:hypothetical protein